MRKLVIKYERTGDHATAIAEGTPEELATFVAQWQKCGDEPKITIEPKVTIDGEAIARDVVKCINQQIRDALETVID